MRKFEKIIADNILAFTQMHGLKHTKEYEYKTHSHPSNHTHLMLEDFKKGFKREKREVDAVQLRKVLRNDRHTYCSGEGE